MKVVILEDEAPATRRLSKLIHNYDPNIEIEATFESVNEGVSWFRENPEPDLIFSDIQLSDHLSFELFKRVSVSAPIIFTTAYDEYALRAFKLHSLDYLLKPIRFEQLRDSMNKYHHFRKTFSQPDFEQIMQEITQKSKKQRFLVQKGENLHTIPVEDVAYLYAEHAAVMLVSHNDGQHFVNYSLDELEHLLDSTRFFRINRQFLISFEAIHHLTQHFNRKLLLNLQPRIDKQVLISKERSAKFKEWLNR